MPMITVETNERRKTRMTRNASKDPKAASCQRFSIDCRMYVDWSRLMLTVTPGGMPRSFGMAALTASTMSTVLPPGCLFTRR
jgi:hypothetical protein